MASEFRQFVLLMRKNGLLTRRKPVQTCLEVCVPCILPLVLLIIRQYTKAIVTVQPTHYDSFIIDDKLPPWLLPPGLLPPRMPNLPPMPNQWLLAFAPDLPVIERIAWDVSGRLGMIPLGFKTEELLVKNTTSIDWGQMYLSAIVFNVTSENANELPYKIQYKVRPKAEPYNKSDTAGRLMASGWMTELMFPSRTNQKDSVRTNFGWVPPGYYKEGFLTVQRAVDLAIIRVLNNTADVDGVVIEMRMFSDPPLRSDPFVHIINDDLPSLFVVSFLLLTATICKEMVLEKEKKLKESMKLMGMKGHLYWFAWLLKYAITMFVTSLLITLVFHVSVDSGAIINFSDFTVSFVFIYLYALSVITFSFAVSACMAHANAAAAAGGILLLLLYLPFYFVNPRYSSLSWSEKMAACLDMNVAMAFGWIQMAEFEESGVGCQWQNIREPVNTSDNFSMACVFIMLAADICIYSLLSWYLDALFPGDFGARLPIHFPFTPSYWFGSSMNERGHSAVPHDLEYHGRIRSTIIGIKIRDLSKIFPGQPRPSVDELTLDMKEGDITALLGHNGAGKTTTMFILTGFLSPTSGTAWINGLDIRKNMKTIRQNLGLCPQHDILFDPLTVSEHLFLFAELKGCKSENVQAEVNRMINVLRLEEKRNVQSKNLSGGQKRKLSVGIALIAGSKFIILDEPTSGMDPESRRQTWEILQAERSGRTMILSTHFMDEADLLSDYIAIMANGRLQCHGTSMDLKRRYGIGYHLTIIKTRACKPRHVTKVVRLYVPEAVKEQRAGSELNYILPSEQSDKFEGLFEILEKNMEKLGIESFGASVTTMEEVFIKVGETFDSVHKIRPLPLPLLVSKALASKSNKTQSVSSMNDSQLSESHRSSFDILGQASIASQDTPGLSPIASSIDASVVQEVSSSIEPLQTQASTAEEGHRQSVAPVTGYVKKRLKSFYYIDRDDRRLSIVESEHSSSSSDNDDVLAEGVYGFRLHHSGAFVRKIQQTRAMLIKHVLHSWRNLRMSVCQILSPVTFVIIACLIIDTMPVGTDPPALSLTLDHFPSVEVPYHAERGLEHLRNCFVDAVKEQDKFVFDTGNVNVDNYLLSMAVSHLREYNKRYFVAGSVAMTTVNINAHLPTLQGLFRGNAYHTIAMSLALVDRTLSRCSVPSLYTVETVNHPLPRQPETVVQDKVMSAMLNGFVFAYCVTFGLAFLVSSFIILPLKERSSGSKHIQFISGVTSANFWITAFIWDLFNFAIPALMILIVLEAFSIDAYIDGIHIWYVFLNLFGYAWAILPMMYLLSLVFVEASSGFVWAVVINILTATGAMVVIYVLKSPKISAYDVADILVWICYIILPNFCFGDNLENLYMNYQLLAVCREIKPYCAAMLTPNQCCPENCGPSCVKTNENFLGIVLPGIGAPLLIMFSQGVFWFLVLLFVESGSMIRLRHHCARPTTRHRRHRITPVALKSKSSFPGDDVDVIEERDRIMSTPLVSLFQTDCLIVRNMSRTFAGFHAVSRLSFGIRKGECFGLLGINGAGKTTTFKVMTGVTAATHGDVYLASNSITNQVREAQTHFGYCPQFDALIDQLTVHETLYMFARLRGLVESNIDKNIDTIVTLVTLQKHKQKQAGDLSGGNRRKLSTAIALIGDPQIVFLDEPTTGMDPIARRHLWNTLNKVRKSGKTLVLTSHSMEECEALCTKLAIMVNGTFKCIGSTQHLKTKFGKGYLVIVKILSPTSNEEESLANRIENFISFVGETFIGSELKDRHEGLLHFHVPSEEMTWSKIFGTVERAKVKYFLEDYSVSQTSLEQVFISFARPQHTPREVDKTCMELCRENGCCCCTKIGLL